MENFRLYDNGETIFAVHAPSREHGIEALRRMAAGKVRCNRCVPFTVVRGERCQFYLRDRMQAVRNIVWAFV